ncbi:MAG: hypothetical protein HYU41_15705 [Candidatus Rokubacteria bacterium]|nr:hypothetical protein [Candidatus Rokubacteria bacterium]
MIKTSYPLNKVLTALVRRHVAKAGLTDDDMTGVELAAAERDALRRGDVAALYDLGANPYLIRRVFRGNFKK